MQRLEKTKQLIQRKRINKPVPAIILLFLLSFTIDSFGQYSLQEAFPNLHFSYPVDLQHSGDGSNRIFVVEQEGIINVFNNSPEVSESRIFLDITDIVLYGDEMGLLGLAFDPDYENNGYFYVNYIKASPLQTRISRFKVTSDPDSADILSEEIILSFNQPYTNHNGGQLAFGSDGYLYIATGDGGSSGDPQNNGQRLNTLLGKILRIDINNTMDTLKYAIPPDNPFSPSLTARPEIYAYGLRNPWRISFDSTGRLWCADVGQNNWEEIDTIKKGGNYGWNTLEGSHCYNPSTNCDTTGLIPPVYEYPHNSTGGYSITGGYVYEGNNIPGLRGKYIFADYVTRHIWSLSYSDTNTSTPAVDLLATADFGISSFGVDENKELYLCVFDGNIYKLVAGPSAVDSPVTNPSAYALYQNYPNPFNPSTTVSYYLPEESYVTLEVISPNGELVSVLEKAVKQQGLSASEWNASGYSSGAYYIMMNAESISSNKKYRQVLKIMLIK